MKHQIEFEPALSNFLDESFSNGSGVKPKKAPKPKKVKKTKADRGENTNVGRSRAESSSRDIADSDDSGSVSSGKPKLTAEQIQQGVDVATNVLSQLPKNQAKQDLKAACGRKPLLKKKRADWDKCASDYAQNKNQAPSSQDSQPKQNYDNSPPTDEKKFYQKPLFIVGVSAVVLLGGFLAYKFFKKTPVVPAV